jgi:hypothetical protein
MNEEGVPREYHAYGPVRDSFIILVVRPKGKRSMEDLSVDERMIFKWIIKKWDWRMRTGFM